jgi:hypothetical protein
MENKDIATRPIVFAYFAAQLTTAITTVVRVVQTNFSAALSARRKQWKWYILGPAPS